MIALHNIAKSYPLPRGKKVVLDDVNITFRPGENMGILGLNGAGKSTLMRIIGGAELPDSGKVVRKSRVSWPIGFAGGFHGSLTGRENLRFTSRIYGSDIRKVTEFVEDFSELGPYMDMPVRTYSSGMKSKLAFGLSMAIGFDFYLIDEAYSVGDAAFQAKGERVFQERKASSTLIVVSHSVSTIRKNCDNAAVLFGGKLMCFATWRTRLPAIRKFVMLKSDNPPPLTLAVSVRPSIFFQCACLLGQAAAKREDFCVCCTAAHSSGVPLLPSVGFAHVRFPDAFRYSQR